MHAEQMKTTIPHHEPSERAVIGTLLQSPQQLDFVREILKAEDFFYSRHRLIFRAIESLQAETDIVSVSERLESDGTLEDAGGMPYLGLLIDATPSTKNVGTYARAVANNASARAVIKLGANLAGTDAETWQACADTAMKSLLEIGGVNRRWEHSMESAIRGAINALETAQSREGLVGIPTGLTRLDTQLGGLHATDLIVIGARPAMGKTALMLNCVKNGGGVSGVISTEQPADQLALRLIAIDGGINAMRLRNGQLNEKEWKRVADITARLNAKPWRINDQPSITIGRLERQARAWKRQHDIQALYVDYIQNIRHDDRKLNKTEAIGDVIKRLKQLARELKIPVVALAQVNRQVEGRIDKRPKMGDLYHSSEIEMEADVVMLLYRDAVYNPDTPDKGTAELIIDKNRHGPTGFTRVAWLPGVMRFQDMADT